MKRVFCLLILFLFLCGCIENGTGETQPSQIQAKPWVTEVGEVWDPEGELLEIPLTIPGGLQYSSVMEFDGDLLLWSVDRHLQDTCILELCLLELDDGTISAQADIRLEQGLSSVTPQVLGSSLYLCDNLAGKVYELDKQLTVVNTWQVFSMTDTWYMGGNNTLYTFDWEGTAQTIDLETGMTAPLLGQDTVVSNFAVSGSMAMVEYYRPDTGATATALVNISTGEIFEPALDLSFLSLSVQSGTWLCGSYDDDGHTYYLDSPEMGILMAELEYDTLQFMDESTILRIPENGTGLSLHYLDGTVFAQCQLTADPYSISCPYVIYNAALDGYFCVIEEYGTAMRLLFWSPNQSCQDNIPFTPMPEPSETERALQERAQMLSEKYGVDILVGEECGEIFASFTAASVTDWDMVSDALDTLDRALSQYPEGFFRQLRYGSIRKVEIQLVGALTPDAHSDFSGSYSAFTQAQYDRSLMVVDVFSSTEQTYYHEISHIIDLYLEWDASQRSNALYSEQTWASLNPGWFPGYTYDYGWMQDVLDYTSFIDPYATISPTEDRARLLEYAMVDYYNNFAGGGILCDKLAYYCRCIRDAFDTTGWPEVLPWEQYL